MGFDSLSHRQIKAKGISILLVLFVALGQKRGKIAVFSPSVSLVKPSISDTRLAIFCESLGFCRIRYVIRRHSFTRLN